MNFLSDIITYIRRIIKTPSAQVITDELLIDYINRFWIMDIDARAQLYDFRTTYQLLTVPGIDRYNMPLYSLQTEPGSQIIASYPVYQGFAGFAKINGIVIPFYTQPSDFYNLWPTYLQQVQQVATGNGTAGPYNINLSFFPVLPAHIDLAGIMASSAGGNAVDPIYTTSFKTNVPVTSVSTSVYLTANGPDGQNIVVTDSGQFLSGTGTQELFGLLMQPGQQPLGNSALPGVYSTTNNTINYNTGQITVTFPQSVPKGQPINAQWYFIAQGLPRAILFYNNTIVLRNPPNTQYLVELDAYLTPAAFLSSAAALPFAYMAEYIARGAARKILTDTGDAEQFQFYEPLFREQESLVWKRSQRQFTATRTQTIYSGFGAGNVNSTNGLFGAGAT